jgi:hypothetical protein
MTNCMIRRIHALALATHVDETDLEKKDQERKDKSERIRMRIKERAQQRN